MYQALSRFTILLMTGSWAGAWEQGYIYTATVYGNTMATAGHRKMGSYMHLVYSKTIHPQIGDKLAEICKTCYQWPCTIIPRTLTLPFLPLSPSLPPSFPRSLLPSLPPSLPLYSLHGDATTKLYQLVLLSKGSSPQWFSGSSLTPSLRR